MKGKSTVSKQHRKRSVHENSTYFGDAENVTIAGTVRLLKKCIYCQTIRDLHRRNFPKNYDRSTPPKFSINSNENSFPAHFICTTYFYLLDIQCPQRLAKEKNLYFEPLMSLLSLKLLTTDTTEVYFFHMSKIPKLYRYQDS